jgi:hypothetical protein
MQRYIREVFADRLRQEGFASYKNQDIHWYRLVNNEVVQAVYFVTRHTTLHAFVEICYGCHPLFIPPVFQKSPYMYNLPGYEQMNDVIPETSLGSAPYGFEGLRLHGMYNRPYRTPDVLIMCPKDKNNGLDILEKLFPVLDKTNTPLACYEMHKKRRTMEIENGSFLTMSTYFIDEVLFWEDRELYPFCKEYVINMIAYYEKLHTESKHTRREDREQMSRLLALKEVFENGANQVYKDVLHARTQKNRILIQKYITEA